MPRKLAALLMAAMLLFVSGCWDSVEIDDQCYLLALAIDSARDGGVQLTTSIPTVVNEGGESKEDTKDNMVTVVGRNFNEAVDILYASTPRNVNLSQLKLLLFSQEVARSEQFVTLLHDLLSYRGMRRTASVVFCQENAAKFLEATSAIAGMQLSKSIEIAISSYLDSSYMPHTRLLDLYLQMKSIHGTGIAACGAITPGYGEGDPIENPIKDDMQPGDFSADDIPHRGASSTELIGTALFNQTSMVDELTGYETQLMMFLRGEGKYNLISVPVTGYSDDDLPVYGSGGFTNIVVRSHEPPDISIREEGGSLIIDIDMPLHGTLTRLSGEDIDLEPLRAAAQNVVQRDSEILLANLRDRGLDPVGFTKVMVRRFLTVQEWKAYNWEEAYKQAQINLNVHVDLQSPSREPGGLPLVFH